MTPELLSIQPNELKFTFEVKKQSFCSVQLVNHTDQYVAYKVKTTSPKKYCVRPNIGIVLPNSTCDFTVTMQAQRVAPPDMQCKDKFLIQSTVVPFGSTEEDISATTFAKESGRFIEEDKLRVVLVSPPHSPVLLPISGTLKQESDFEAPVIREAVWQESDFVPPVIKGTVRKESDFEAPVIKGSVKQEPASEALITKGALKQEPAFEALLSNGACKKGPAYEDSVLQDQIPSEIKDDNVVDKNVEELNCKIHHMESELNELVPKLTEIDFVG
ncbi:vesicle-associated protein 2-2-like isoform X2 [Aristolochia californica]|uniref:vesicle-associated protein 2-2-like isoform X2 n=1 Tax=Aristolochia californica TaxID=171875 RepID=UPI0035D7A0C0